MPITIKSTELKYKNPSTGQYQGIDAVAETTTSQQCALIEAKGAETIASIPSDYTTLANNVSDLSDAINDKIVRVTGTISSSSLVISNANVTASMVPISCEFGTPTNVSSASYTITTGSGTITFSGITLIASTTVDVILGVPKT